VDGIVSHDLPILAPAGTSGHPVSEGAHPRPGPRPARLLLL